MKLEVEKISEEIVEPSSPTPDHLRLYKLSFIDQITVHIFAPALYFFQSNGDSNFSIDFKTKLKISLSTLLTHFPPLAGRPNYSSSLVDCNDAGVPFTESRVKSTLDEVVRNSNPDDLNDLFPFELDQFNETLMAVQLNVFECGGIAVAICISHKIADAKAVFSVNNIWAAIARGEKDDYVAHLEGAKVFPPKEVSFDPAMSVVRDRVARRFVFEGLKVEAIREKYAEKMVMENQRRPSRVEALSIFVYSRFLNAIKEDSPPPAHRSHLVNFTVNIRSKMEPPLPDDAFGNYYYNTMTFPSVETLNDEYCYGLLKQLREEISKINGDSLKKILNEDDTLMDFVKDIALKFVKGEIVSCAFSSLCRFPIYDTDFGWGKPVWVTFPALWFKNLVAFMDGKDADSIDAIIHLKEQDLAKLEADEEFLKFATLTPQLT